MNMIKYRPVSRSLMNWDVDSVWNNFFNDSLWNAEGNYPRMDVKEDENAYTLEAELAGLTEKDIEVKVENQIITISSRKETEEKKEKQDYLLKERRNQSFSRSFNLPKDAQAENIEAHFKNGVLTLSIQKSPEAKPRTISIESK